MANVWYWSGFWQSTGEANDLQPGDVHWWSAFPVQYGDAVTVTASPVGGAPDQHILAVENLRIEADGGDRRIFYSVRNAGSTAVVGYAVGYGYIRA